MFVFTRKAKQQAYRRLPTGSRRCLVEELGFGNTVFTKYGNTFLLTCNPAVNGEV